MNINYIFNAVRKYGVKGIVDFIAGQRRERAFKRYLEKTMRSAPPEHGITLIAGFDYAGSLNKVMRDFATMLKLSGIPYQTLNLPCKKPIPESELKFFMTPKEEFCFNKYTHIITLRKPITIPDKRCSVHCVQFWELEDGFVEACPESLRSENILALSDFNRDVFRKTLPGSIGVNKILYPFQFIHGDLPPRQETRRKYGIPPDSFVVFFNFDYASCYFRENPEGILKAFARSLADKPDTAIVFKTMRARVCKTMSDRLHSLAAELGLSDRFVTIDDFIPQEDLVNLTDACDVYISLHRGEGFGLGVAEAMSLGKAVIVSDYGSTKEFCKKHNTIPVPCEMIPVPKDIDNDAYRHSSAWAEPDIDAAAAALLRLYGSPDVKASLGRSAAEHIRKYFSIANFRTSITAFLDRKPAHG